ncbi:hypothetical protein [Paenibacillus cymbidii]|uniref:hypothetical protein n=1 Tax=Paenibacillus cymbidii TaxID=1639034 RepID=UPI001081C747|nr:hypothetical protein [Paenibacillus cymbidii]
MSREALLLLGACRIDATPERPVPLAGFAVRSGLGPYASVHRPIHARIFALADAGDSPEPGGEQPASRRAAVVVSADLLWWGSDRVPAFKRLVAARYGLDEDAVLLHGTHSHSAPMASFAFTSYLGAPDTAYIETLEARVLAGIGEALAAMVPVRVLRGSGEFALGINRRGLLRSPPETGPVDHELSVVRFMADEPGQEERTVAVWLHYACHPVITDENRLSDEYPGVAAELLERQLGGGAVVGFLQGACGDINPGDGVRVIRGGAAEVAACGAAFAEAAQRVLAGALRPVAPRPGGIGWRRRVAPLPLQPLPARERLEQGAAQPGVDGEWCRIQLARFAGLQPWLPFEATVLAVADGLSLLGMNAEAVVAYGLLAKRLSAGAVLPLGYTNGMIGYVVTAAMLDEGGYEPVASTIYFAMPAPFAREAEAIVRDTLAELLRD